jgi:hypothetical protein
MSSKTALNTSGYSSACKGICIKVREFQAFESILAGEDRVILK